mgnify:CR=1 FL=1
MKKNKQLFKLIKVLVIYVNKDIYQYCLMMVSLIINIKVI